MKIMKNFENVDFLLLKVDLPGFKKGTFIKKINNKWLHENNSVFPLPVTINDIGVFYDVPVEKFNASVGDVIHIKKQFLSKYQDNIKEFTFLTVTKNDIHSNNIMVVLNDKVFPVDKKHCTNAEIYYFIDSKGMVQNNSPKIDEKAANYRKIIGNYFLNKCDAYEYEVTVVKKITL